LEPATLPSQGSPGGASQFNSLRIIHIALVAGVVFYLALSYFLTYSYLGKPLVEFADKIYLAIVYCTIGFSLTCCSISTILFRKKLGAFSCFDWPAKFIGYRDVLIVRMALLEGPAFLCVVFYKLTSRWIIPAEALVLLSIMIYLNPGLNRFTEELKLNINQISWFQSE
jgi:hypothetical protein